jgi:hypothetical protein
MIEHPGESMLFLDGHKDRTIHTRFIIKKEACGCS